MAIDKGDRFPGLKGLALGGAVLTLVAGYFLGLAWTADQLDLSHEAKGWFIAGGMGGLGALCWYIGARLRN